MVEYSPHAQQSMRHTVAYLTAQEEAVSKINLETDVEFAFLIGSALTYWGVSLEALANEAGFSELYVVKWPEGKNLPQLNVRKRARMHILTSLKLQTIKLGMKLGDIPPPAPPKKKRDLKTR